MVTDKEIVRDQTQFIRYLENFVLLNIEPKLDLIDEINHWRTKTKAEVNFIIKRGLDLYPVEVKARQLSQPVYSKSLRSFLSTYQPKKAFVINLSLEQEDKIGPTEVTTLPFYQNPFSPTF